MATLRNYEQIGMVDRWRLSGDLEVATRRHPHLATELPLSHHAYSDHIRGFRCIKAVRELADARRLQPHVIIAGTTGIGVATAQINDQTPASIQELGKNPVELSYWHQWPRDKERAGRIGQEVMQGLATRAKNEPLGADMLWTVTLPEDGIKADVCRRLGFTGIETPQPYAIGDDVGLPRQLWARPA